MELTELRYIKELQERYSFAAKKKYGQNFLINKGVVEKIAQCGCPYENCGIIEVGPGIGTLTRELSKQAKKVVAVEIDSALLPVLEETLEDCENTEIINADIMKTDVKALIDDKFKDCRNVCVCANLPYYITTPILMSLIEAMLPIRSITVMIQKEVADRLCSDNLEGDYGAITAIIGYYGKATKLFTVSPGSFFPAPSVTSTVIRIDLYDKKPITADNEKLFARVVKGAFGQRRKMLYNALSAEFKEIGKDKLSEIITASGIDPAIRGEKLSTIQFVKLANEIGFYVK